MVGGWQQKGYCTVRFYLHHAWKDKSDLLWCLVVEVPTQYISRTRENMALVPLGPSDEQPDAFARSSADLRELHDAAAKRKANTSPLREVSLEKRHKHRNGGADPRVFARDDRCVYGNPKEVIKLSPPSEAFDSSSVLDLSCKTSKDETNDITYQNYPRNNHPYLPEAFPPRSNLEIKLVNSPKRPSTMEQLQIAKLQQQQRRSIQQQQKMMQQMRRTLDTGGRASVKAPPDPPKEETQPPHAALLAPPFSHPPPFMDTQGKALPEEHPVLPLLDPVYFSALYNAHGFMPPSSPSIAAAFIGTLQDALPKLAVMFPPSSSAAGSSLLHQQEGDHRN